MTTKMVVEITGFAEAEAKLQKIDSSMLDILGGVLRREGENIMSRSVPLVPVDTGVLRASRTVQGPKIGGTRGIAKTVVVTLGYGGAAKAYATIQHENLSYRHTVGQAKFLEVPFNEAMQGIGQRIGVAVQLQLRAL